MDKLTSIKTFHAVVKHRSFSQAAHELGMSPQLVSKYISALESDIGIRLINRTTRRLNLTSEGGAYYEESLRIIESLEALEGRLTDLKLNPSGLLRVSAPVSLGSQRLGSIVGDYIRRFPEMTIDIQLNDRKVDIIDEGFDIALRIGSLVDSSLVARKLAPVDVLVCASPAYLKACEAPEDIADLQHHRVLKYSYLASQGSFDTKSPPIISNSGELLANAAEAGVGVVVGPRYIVNKALAQGRLVELFPYRDTREQALYALYPHRTLTPLKVKSFIDFLASAFADERL